MPVFQDQLSREILINTPPQRIISLVPSQTEFLYNLDLDKEVIGITKFCVHPQHWFRTRTRVGGTKQIDLQRIEALRPDLILANKQENVKDQIETLANQYPVYISDVHDLPTAIDMMNTVGSMCNRLEQSMAITKNIQQAFNNLEQTGSPTRVAYLIWREPYMTIGGDTFINQMLQYAGFDNVYKAQNRYPTISISDLQTANCELILLSSEPYPFQQKHIDELSVHLPKTKIVLVDGEMFSWFGSRLLYAPDYFNQLQRKLRELSAV